MAGLNGERTNVFIFKGKIYEVIKRRKRM